jgi:hypothetical protein
MTPVSLLKGYVHRFSNLVQADDKLYSCLPDLSYKSINCSHKALSTLAPYKSLHCSKLTMVSLYLPPSLSYPHHILFYGKSFNVIEAGIDACDKSKDYVQR